MAYITNVSLDCKLSIGPIKCLRILTDDARTFVAVATRHHSRVSWSVRVVQLCEPFGAQHEIDVAHFRLMSDDRITSSAVEAVEAFLDSHPGQAKRQRDAEIVRLGLNLLVDDDDIGDDEFRPPQASSLGLGL